jgi:hypothetical protein
MEKHENIHLSGGIQAVATYRLIGTVLFVVTAEAEGKGMDINPGPRLFSFALKSWRTVSCFIY